ncbi:MAG: O-Antigen ligase [Lentisphaerae bacterium ADurb.Bin242]|nr:MAG: O-Antigen ligase [Lentisphaerae bacterium ADurb.Bin242]
MELKFLIFFAVLLVGVPIGIFLAYFSRFVEKCCFIGLLSLSVIVDAFSINFFSNEFYRGSVRGMEITLVDLVALVLAVVMLLKNGKLQLNIPGIWFFLIYFTLSAISVVNAENGLFSFLELWKMYRMLIYFIVIFNYLEWRKDFELLIYSFAGVAYMTFAVVLFQKYALKIYQPRGTFPHQNSMAVYMELTGPFLLALWLNTRMASWKTWIIASTFFAMTGSAILTLSRAAMLFYPFGCVIVALISLRYGQWERKLKVLLALGLLGVLGLFFILPRILSRLETAPEASTTTRVNLAIAAVNMANDKFWGVGINNWGIKINPPYNYSEHRTTKRYTDEFKDGIVETIYLLVAAECGWIGFTALLLWLFCYLWYAFRLMVTYARTNIFSLPLGLFAGLSAIYVHSTLEWMLKQTSNFYQLMLMFGILAVLWYWHSQKETKKFLQENIFFR